MACAERNPKGMKIADNRTKSLRSAAERAADLSYREATKREAGARKKVTMPARRPPVHKINVKADPSVVRFADSLGMTAASLFVGGSQDAVCGPTPKNEGWGTRKGEKMPA
jgi:hypothetical protein